MNYEESTTAERLRLLGLVALAIAIPAVLFAYVFPQYNVWQQSMSGKAELQKAEYTRQVAVLEAQAKKIPRNSLLMLKKFAPKVLPRQTKS